MTDRQNVDVLSRQALVADTGATVQVGSERVPLFEADIAFLNSTLVDTPNPAVAEAVRRVLQTRVEPVTVIPTPTGWFTFVTKGVARASTVVGIFVPDRLGVDPVEMLSDEAFYAQLEPTIPSDPEINLSLEDMVSLSLRSIQTDEELLALDQRLAINHLNIVDHSAAAGDAHMRRSRFMERVEMRKAALDGLVEAQAAVEIRVSTANADYINRKASVKALSTVTKQIQAQLDRYVRAVDAYSSPAQASARMQTSLNRLGVETDAMKAIRLDAQLRREALADQGIISSTREARLSNTMSKEQAEIWVETQTELNRLAEKYNRLAERELRKARRELRRQRSLAEQAKEDLARADARADEYKRLLELEVEHAQRLKRLEREARREARELERELKRLRKEEKRLIREKKLEEAKRARREQRRLERLKRENIRKAIRYREGTLRVSPAVPRPLGPKNPPTSAEPEVTTRVRLEPATGGGVEIIVETGHRLPNSPSRDGDSKISKSVAALAHIGLYLAARGVDAYNVSKILIENMAIVMEDGTRVTAYTIARDAYRRGAKSEINLFYFVSHMNQAARDGALTVDWPTASRQIVTYFAGQFAAGKIQSAYSDHLKRQFEAAGMPRGVRVSFKLDTVLNRVFAM